MSELVVAKVGGSLLDWPGLPAALTAVLDACRDQRVVLIAGGGPIADCVRELDRCHGLGEERAHRLALHALDLSAHGCAALLPDRLRVTDSRAGLDAVWSQGAVPVLQPRRWLDEQERSGATALLPHCWDVTTDSIAAHLAVGLGAATLWLLKSVTVTPPLDIQAVADRGIVDPHFPQACRGLPRILGVNLREPAWAASVRELRPADPAPAGVR